MSQKENKPGYFSYLLRLWETTDGERRVWRASLEYPTTGQRRGFASLADLLAYLEHEIGLTTGPSAAPTGPPDASPMAQNSQPDP